VLLGVKQGREAAGQERSAKMHQGRIVEYIDRGDFIIALCLQDDGTRLHLLTPTNREMNLPPKRAVLISTSSIPLQSPREELLRKLKKAEEERNRLKEQVHVQELWELVKDDAESYDHAYLAQLCFGEQITDHHISGLVRALFEDKLYFKMKDDRFLPNSEEKIVNALAQVAQEASKEEKLREGSEWLRGVLENKPVQEPRCKEEIIKVLADLALFGEDSPNLKFGKELLQRAGVPDIRDARRILVSLGVWSEDENLDLLRFEIRVSFSEEHLRESERICRAETSAGEREDLRDLRVWTVDGPMTRDFDDALSLRLEEDTIHLGVHIADVAGVIDPESLLDEEASQRGTSLYLPGHQIPMIPAALSQEALSLKRGCDRPAISLLAVLARDGNLIESRFVQSLVRVEKQWTYDEVNDSFDREPLFQEMRRLSQVLRQKRLDQGALVLSLPEIAVEVTAQGSVVLHKVEQDTPSRGMVAEFMILYNWLAARFCKDHQIPAIYRCQEAPAERLSPEVANYIYYVFKQRRKLSPLSIHTEPKPHSSLGVDMYTTVSSPIRRYYDLLVQRQIRNYLRLGVPLYTREDMEKKRLLLDPLLKSIELLTRNSTRYWIQKYLAQHVGEKFPAFVLDVIRNKYRVLLSDVLLIAEVKRENGQSLHEGQEITVKIRKSDPWEDYLKVDIEKR
jgi:exoribonuclease-2